MAPTLSLGPLVIPTAPFVIIIGFWLMLDVTERVARRRQLDSRQTYNLVAAALLAGLIGARLTFVARHWTAYQDNLWGIIWPLTSGYTVWAGLPIGLFAALLYARRHQLPLWPTLDALAPSLFLGLMALSLADFLGGPGFGKTTNMIWGIELFSVRRHPVQVYELLAGGAALWLWWRLAYPVRTGGVAFLGSAAAYSALRLYLDAYRDNAPLTSGGYHIIQLIAFAVMLLCLYLLTNRTSLSHNNPEKTDLKT